MGYSEALTAALLNTLRPPTIQPTAPGAMSVAEGQLIRATVQQITDQTVLLNVAGQLISAKTDVPLQPRQQVLLNVQQAGPDQITLQIISDSATPPTAAASASTAAPLPESLAQNVQQMLVSWGLPADAVNVQLAEALLTHAHTLNPQDVQAARQAWVQLPNPTPADLNAVAFLQTHRLPLSEESVSLAKEWLNGLLPIANRLTAVQQTLTAVLNQLQPAAQSNPALNQLTTVLQSTLEQIAQWHITPDTPPTEIAARLESLVVNLNTPPEASLAKQPAVLITAKVTVPTTNQPAAATDSGSPPALPASQNGSTAQPANPSAAPETPAPAAKAATVPARGATLPAAQSTPIAQSTPSAPHHAAPQSVPANTPLDNPLHQLAHIVSNALADANLPPGQANALHQLSQQLHNLAQDLGAVQLSNLANTLATDTGQYYLFPVPLHHADGTQTTARLKIFRQPGRQSVNPENTRVALLLDLPSLGEIAIDLTVFKRQISGRVLTGQAETNALVAAKLSDLQSRLSAIGYRVEGLSTAMLTGKTNDDTLSEKPAVPPKLTGIDVSF